MLANDSVSIHFRDAGEVVRIVEDFQWLYLTLQ